MTVDLTQEIKKENRKVYWIHGPSGSGKTTLIEKVKNAYHKDETKWWDGWNDESNIVLDEFESNEYWNSKRILKVLGGERLRVEYKGGSKWLRAKKIYIACIDPPDIWWKRRFPTEPYEQLKRRIHKIVAQGSNKGNNNTLFETNH